MADKYKVYLSDYDGNSIRLPVLPSELPEISFEADTEDFQNIKGGHYTIIGKRQQPTLSAEHLLPDTNKSLSFCVSETTGKQVVKLLKQAQKTSYPVRYTIAKRDGGYYINRLYAVTSFTYHIDKKNDYVVSFDLTGWKRYKGWKKAADFTNSTTKTVKISPSKVTINKGKQKTITLKNAPSGAKVTWSSTDKTIAAVNSKGVITGKKKGKTTVTATYKKKSYTCEVGIK